jgi:hypothetical protein
VTDRTHTRVRVIGEVVQDEHVLVGGAYATMTVCTALGVSAYFVVALAYAASGGVLLYHRWRTHRRCYGRHASCHVAHR